MSYITKKKIALACKDLIVKTDIDQVSVTKIMKSVGMRRQTFYDLFIDKYDAIEWLYNDEITEIIEDNLEYETWEKIVNYLCAYFFKNRSFFKKILNDPNQNNLSKTLMAGHVKKLIEVIMLDMIKVEHITFSDDEFSFTTTIFANSLIEEIRNWISTHNPRKIDEETNLINLYISDSISGMLLRNKAN
ncbi:dihydroxyacetone kinase transcriptional activator DhaS [Companilactobacillus sp. RD055328]|uniref:dihydroxyacetone kinase transcriptional activator DhaS n=1 Tax=Companilactobacillus sp. RD055328 TaxID=2916634 RepID=UPI001FC88379|nr:dihydroxyacetone kinase transcriptional activator DhaS [Companilactobacillus sp. RD055328]GKQ42351.1 dihydroxyacetone kinase transcriptional activator DhaS [Companilactobacillus sp. RD055328]